MAGYNIVLDTKFKPFSYQEMLAPVAAATQAHQAVEEEYGNLATKASVWENMANEQSDPYTYKMYKTYADDLEAQAEQLARDGLTSASRSGMLNMRARYSKEITPIENAYKRREELAAEQRKAITANPTLRYQRMADQMSLDDYIRNPSLDYGKSYSGALLTQQVSQAAASFQRALTDKSQLKSLNLPYQYERMLQYGATPAQVMAAMGDKAQQGDTESIKFLRGITDQVLQSSGVADWADPTTMREFRAFANQGLYSVIGQAKLDNFTDQAGLTKFKADLDEEKAIRAEGRRVKLEEDAQLKAKPAEDDQLKAIQLSGTSYLSASGDFEKYGRVLSELKVGNNGVKASIFGKNGTVNPVTVYDQAQREMDNAEKKVRDSYASKLKRAELNVGRYSYDDGSFYEKANRVRSEMNSEIVSARNNAYSKTLQDYGVTRTITKDQYDVLNDIGYKGDTIIEYSQLENYLNALAQQRTYYSTNMSGYDIPDKKIRAQMGNWETNGSFATRVYKLNANGTQGKKVSYKDLDLYNDSNDDGRKVTGIYYSAFTPDKIIVQIGEGGDRYLVDPNALGSEVANMIKQTANYIKSNPGEDLTIASISTTNALSRMLNSYNPTAPKSSKEAAE